MTITTWGIYSRVAGIQLHGYDYATEAEAQKIADTLNATYDPDHKRSPKAIARWAHLDGKYFGVVSPAQQEAWAIVDMSR